MNSTFTDLKSIVRSYLLNNKLDKINSKLLDIYELSLSLNVPCVVGYTLKNNNQYNEIFDKSIYKSLNKYSSFMSYKKKIDELFEIENIRYIYLKGETIGRYYKEPYLRFSSDIDMIIHKDDYDKALDLLKNKLNFKEKKSSVNEITLVNKDDMNIDFHRIPETERAVLETIFDTGFKSHELDDNNKYIYLLAHQAKHILTGQLDLRFFIDLYYLRNLIKKDRTDPFLKQLKLKELDNALNSYLDYILLLHNPTDLDLKIEHFVISYSNDMGASNRVNNNENKLIFLIKHAFPSYKVMKGVFPILKEKPILLPYYYIVRIVKALKGDRKNYIADELKASFSKSNSELINELGLSSYNK